MLCRHTHYESDKGLESCTRLFNRTTLILRLREPVWPSGKAGKGGASV